MVSVRADTQDLLVLTEYTPAINHNRRWRSKVVLELVPLDCACHPNDVQHVIFTKMQLITLVGSSRSTLFTIITSSRSVNHPFGRNHVFVCVGDGGMLKKDATPIANVIKPLWVQVSKILVVERFYHSLDQK